MDKPNRFTSIYEAPEEISKDDLKWIESPDEENPLGKGHTIENDDQPMNHQSLSLVYTECESFNVTLSNNFRIIIGRRGSGKSALVKILENHIFFKYAIKINPHELRQFAIISSKGSASPLSVDEYVAIIKDYFNLQILFLVEANYDAAKFVRNYLKYTYEIKENITEILPAWRKWLKSQTNSLNVLSNAASGLADPFINKLITSKKEAYDEAQKLLNNNNIVILIDNPEDFVLDLPGSKNIFQAMIYASATYQPKIARVVVKCFIPTEIFGYISKNAVNWGKVKERLHSLSWKPEELLTLVAKRIRLYKLAAGLIENNITNIGELTDFAIAKKEWETLFIKKVKNSVFSLHEHSFQYLIRHTQLIPRQIIRYGNAIIKDYTKNECCDNTLSNCYKSPISEKHIIIGINKAEFDNAKDALNSFSAVYDSLEEFCQDYLSKLQYKMSYS